MSSKIKITNFNLKINQTKKINLTKYLKKITSSEWPEFLKSFKKNYKYSYDNKLLKKYKYFKNINIIGMGGSSLGSKAIYKFLHHKIKKKLTFSESLNLNKENINKGLNIIISKSGNTLETIVNSNLALSKNKKNIFITENKNNYLKVLADKLKVVLVEHKNFIGGRFSVLSEVGMLPSQLMGLSENKFKQYNRLIVQKKFLNDLINNTLCTYELIKKKKIKLYNFKL